MVSSVKAAFVGGGGVSDGSHVLLMGPPGAGKGTQGDKLARARRLHKLSTGDMLRHHVREQTELGKQAKQIMDAGDLVPDGLIVDMVEATVDRTR